MCIQSDGNCFKEAAWYAIIETCLIGTDTKANLFFDMEICTDQW